MEWENDDHRERYQILTMEIQSFEFLAGLNSEFEAIREKKRFSLLILWRCSFGAFWTIFSGYCSGSSSVQISLTVLSLVIGVSCREKDQRSSVDY